MKSLAAAALLAAAAATTISAAPITVGWNARVAVTPTGSHLLGNPAASTRLVEYVSYTCPHCAHFASESEGPLRLAYIASGRVSIEVRHQLRDPIDLAVALLTNCGPKEKFFANHQMFLQRQANWIGPMSTASPAQRARWVNPDQGTRGRAIASDFHFYEMMESRGYSRPEMDRCLADRPMAERLAAQSQAGYAAGVRATPSFAINGTLLDGVHEWAALRPKLDGSLN